MCSGILEMRFSDRRPRLIVAEEDREFSLVIADKCVRWREYRRASQIRGRLRLFSQLDKNNRFSKTFSSMFFAEINSLAPAGEALRPSFNSSLISYFSLGGANHLHRLHGFKIYKAGRIDSIQVAGEAAPLFISLVAQVNCRVYAVLKYKVGSTKSIQMYKCAYKHSSISDVHVQRCMEGFVPCQLERFVTAGNGLQRKQGSRSQGTRRLWFFLSDL